MRYFVIFEIPLLIYQLQEFINNGHEIILLMKEGYNPSLVPYRNIRICNEDPSKSDTYKKLIISKEDRVILHAVKRNTIEKILQSILKVCENVPIVVLITNLREKPQLDQINIIYLPLKDFLQMKIDKQWLYIRNREWTQKLRELTKGTEKILILTQHDPDPDALASGLALRTLLGRNRATAPIGSFGKITRNENLNMIRLLDIRHNIINQKSLNNYAMIALVDVQPPYFGDKLPRADIVFDHHPQPEDYESSFKDIRIHYGATSTILSEYLLSNNIKIKQRLATALLYGIKTDTFMLGREVNVADIEAFTYIYPQANHNLMRRMEHPSLNPEEVNSFIKALKRQNLIEKILFTHLGLVKKEDIIPRLADFCLQVAGAEWSVVSGVFQKKLVISIRNVGYVKNAGEIIRKIFPDSSIAGGHRTMAKAVIPLEDFKKSFGIVENKDIYDTIIKLFKDTLKREVS